MALVPGSFLGRYRIVRQLGAGAMGEVYLAEDPQIERQLAIKTVRLDAAQDAGDPRHTQLRLRMEREAKAAGRLVHPHVVTLFDAGEGDDGIFYLAFEYVDGPDLAVRARRSPRLTVADVVRIGREAAEALDAAHRVGIIHRDIKPSNILLTPEGSVKIADFGIATLVGQATQLTHSGSVVGTPQYLAPEQVRGEFPIDGRSDLFAIGVVLYELLAGKRPFEGGTVAGLLYAIVSSEPAPLAEVRPDLPPRLVAAVTRLLAKDREQRFPSAAALAAELRAIERQLDGEADRETLRDTAVAPRDEAPTVAPPAAVPPTLMPHAPERTRSSRPLVVLGVAAVVVLMLLAVAGFQIYRNVRADRGQVATTTGGSAVATASGTVGAQVTESATAETTTTTEPAVTEAQAPQAEMVASVVTFRISPSEAADSAVVKVDGLVRGLAGSVMTLRPGEHTIEIVARGYETATFRVDARDDASAPTDFNVTLTKR